MPAFRYKAKNKSGQLLEGILEGERQQDVVAELRGMGHFILSIQPMREKSIGGNPLKLFTRWIINPIFTGSTVADLAVFYRQFATMIKAGMTLNMAMTALKKQGSNRRLRKIAAEAEPHLQMGGKLSDAFAAYPWMFPPLHLHLIRAGEVGGSMELMLDRIADFLESENKVRQKLRVLTLYQKILILAVIFIPNLPILILSSPMAYLKATMGILVPILGWLLAFWVIHRLLSQIPSYRDIVDQIKLGIPKIGKLVRMMALSKFYHGLAIFYAAGMPLSQAIAYTANSCGNSYLARKLKTAIPKVDEGVSISEALTSTKVLPSLVEGLLATGAQTGNVDLMMRKAAEYTENEAEVLTSQYSIIAGVALLLGVAIYIAMYVISFYTGYAQKAIGG